ncbi:MAG: hypothetical protein SOY88_12120 [Massilioclostridium sp.]|nr:hypothetical protein [Massilioclostridium sp.]
MIKYKLKFITYANLSDCEEWLSFMESEGWELLKLYCIVLGFCCFKFIKRKPKKVKFIFVKPIQSARYGFYKKYMVNLIKQLNSKYSCQTVDNTSANLSLMRIKNGDQQLAEYQNKRNIELIPLVRQSLIFFTVMRLGGIYLTYRYQTFGIYALSFFFFIGFIYNSIILLRLTLSLKINKL